MKVPNRQDPFVWFLAAVALSVVLVVVWVNVPTSDEELEPAGSTRLSRQQAAGEDPPVSDTSRLWGQSAEEPPRADPVSDTTRRRERTAEEPPRADPNRVASLGREDTDRAAAGADPQTDEQRASQDQNQRNAEPENRSEEPAEEKTEEESENALEDQLDTNLWISGRVLNEVGEPLAGIGVIARALRLFQLDEGSVIPPSLREQYTWSGANGTYRFDQLADGEYLVGTAATDQGSTAQITVRAGVDFADLVVAQRVLYGVIRSTGGEPLGGVRARPLISGAQPKLSNEDGGYELRLTLPGTSRKVFIRFEREGYHTQQLEIGEADWSGGVSLPRDVAMEPVEALAVVTGNVQNVYGQPVAGESVHLYSPDRKKSYQAVTDQEGEFTIPRVQAAESYQFWMKPKGPYRDYITEEFQVTGEGLRLEVALEPLDLGSRLSGQMVDADGNPIPYFTLLLRSQDAWHKTRQVTGDGQGAFFAEGVPEGELVFETRSMPRFTVRGVHLGQSTEKHVQVVLDWGPFELEGVVVDRDDNPVSAPDVLLSWTHDHNGTRSSSSRKTASDTNGHFLFTGLGPGRHTLRVNASGFKSTWLYPEVGYEANALVVRLEENLN
jgi:hypothetical protein